MEEKQYMFFHRFGGSSALIDSIPVVEDQGMSLVDHPTVKYVHPPSVLTIPREFIIYSVIMTKAINVISCWYKDINSGKKVLDWSTDWLLRMWLRDMRCTIQYGDQSTGPSRFHFILLLPWILLKVVELCFSSNTVFLVSQEMNFLQRMIFLNIRIYPFTSIFLFVSCFIPPFSLLSGQFINGVIHLIVFSLYLDGVQWFWVVACHLTSFTFCPQKTEWGFAILSTRKCTPQKIVQGFAIFFIKIVQQRFIILSTRKCTPRKRC